MRSSRFKGNHHDYNNSMFSRGERIEQARVKSRKQTFQYREGQNMMTTGPVIKIGFFRDDDDDVKHLKQEGLEFELGGRIYTTDENGCISIANTSWVEDRRAEQNDIRDHLFSLLEAVMDMEDEDILRQLFGEHIWTQIVADHCTPQELSILPTDSLVFARGVSNLKKWIKKRNFAPDQLMTAGKSHHTSNKGNVPEGMDGLLGLKVSE